MGFWGLLGFCSLIGVSGPFLGCGAFSRPIFKAIFKTLFNAIFKAHFQGYIQGLFEVSGPFWGFRAFLGFLTLFRVLGPFQGFGAFSGFQSLFGVLGSFQGFRAFSGPPNPEKGHESANGRGSPKKAANL